MTLKSYAQNFEDVMLWRALKHIKSGLYIDVGAQHPVIDSVSLAFYEHGWRGVHVEPNSHYAQLLQESRPDETVIQAAISDKGAVLKFYEIADTGLSTCDAEIAEQHRASGFAVRETNAPCVTLANVFEPYADNEIHWLKIDVEGLEEQVLQGWKPSKARPWIVVVESTLPLTQIESHDKWEKLILDLDYEFVYFDGLNRYYLSKTHPELKDAFRASPNVFDGFVLSGTSSASFCSLLNNQLATREQELGTQVAQGQAEVQRLIQTFATREQELGSQVAQEQAEVQRLIQTFATREQELGVQVAQWQNELAEARTQLSISSEEFTASQARAEWLENEWNASKTKVDELNRHNHHWWTVTDNLNRELQAVYASRSWRLTVPLRETNLLVKQNKHKVNAGVAMIYSGPRRMARFTLRHALSYVNSHPKIKVIAIKQLAHFPFLKAHLKAFVQKNTSISMPIGSFQNPIGFTQTNSKTVTQADSQVDSVSSCSFRTDIQQNLHCAVDRWRLGKRLNE